MKAQAPLQARDALLAAPYSFIAQSALQPRETIGFPTAMKDGLELFAKLPVLSVSRAFLFFKVVGISACRVIFPRKRVEGLLLLFWFMVLGGFEVDRGFIAEGRVQPGSIIEAFDVVENHEFGLLSGFWKR